MNHLMLVNRANPYRGKNKTLVAFKNTNVLLSPCCSANLSKLMEELDAWGQIEIVSGWRSQQEQEQIYADSLAENGLAFTEQYVALPGHSEHQTGLAVDLALHQAEIDTLCPYFPYTGICETFRELAPRYGLIERYPKGKEAITGIAHEPWHFRYVGAAHAMMMKQMGLTLEEYLETIVWREVK